MAGTISSSQAGNFFPEGKSIDSDKRLATVKQAKSFDLFLTDEWVFLKKKGFQKKDFKKVNLSENQ